MKNVQAFFWAAILAGTPCAVLGAAPGGGRQGGQVPSQAAPSQAAPAQSQPVVTYVPTAGIPVYEGRDPDKIADDDTVITQVIPIKYISAVEVRDTLTALVKPEMPMVACNNALVVTEASCVVKRIVQIICYLDVRRGGDNVIVVVPLRSGNAAEAARQINAVFGSQGGP